MSRPNALRGHWQKLAEAVPWPAFMEGNHDGDTYYVHFEKGNGDFPFHTVRLYGGNTYELNETDPALRALGHRARDFVRAHVVGKKIVANTHKSRDKYGRHLCDIWLEDGTDLLTLLDYEGLLKSRA